MIDPIVNPTATNETLVITNAQLTDRGPYRVTYGSRSATSEVAVLNVAADVTAPFINLQASGTNAAHLHVYLSEPVINPSNLMHASITNTCDGMPLEILGMEQVSPTNVF